jgi:hypothetical protein
MFLLIDELLLLLLLLDDAADAANNDWDLNKKKNEIKSFFKINKEEYSARHRHLD